MLLQSGGYSIPQTTVYQWAFAALILLGAAVAIIAGRYRAGYKNLGENAEHKAALLGSQAAQSPATARVTPSDLERGLDLEGLVRSLLDAERRESTSAEGIGALRAVISEAWSDATESLPDHAVRAGEWGVFVLLAGTLFGATATVTRALQAQPDYPGPSSIVTTAADVTTTFVDWTVAAASLFPLAEVVWALFLTGVLKGAEWLGQNWAVIGIALLASAGALVYLDRQDALTDANVIPDWRSAAVALTGTMLLIWAVGAVGAGFGYLIGFPMVGTALGGLSALVLTLWLVYVALLRLKASLVAASWSPEVGGVDRMQLLGIAIGRLAGALIFLAIPLVAGLVLFGIADGDLGRLLAALGSARPDVKLTILAVGVGVGVLAALAIRDSWGDIRSVSSELRAHSGVRVAALQQGFPLMGAVVIFLLILGLSGSLLAATVIGLLFGAAFSWVGRWLRRARHTASALPETDEQTAVTVSAWTLVDADGQERPYVRVSGTAVAHPDPDRVATVAATVIEESVRGEDVTPRLETFYGEKLLNFGLTEWDEMLPKAREAARKAALLPFREQQTDIIERREFDESVEDVPVAIREQRLAELEALGVIHRSSDAVEYFRDADPWAGTDEVSVRPLAADLDVV